MFFISLCFTCLEKTYRVEFKTHILCPFYFNYFNLFFTYSYYNEIRTVFAYSTDRCHVIFLLKKNKETLLQFEVPLDKDVATGLMNKFPDLPKVEFNKKLTPSVSEKYQL